MNKKKIELHYNLDNINALEMRHGSSRPRKPTVVAMAKFMRTAFKDYEVVFCESGGKPSVEFEEVLASPHPEKFSVEMLRRYVNVFTLNNEARKVMLLALRGSERILEAFADRVALSTHELNQMSSRIRISVSYGVPEYGGTEGPLFAWMDRATMPGSATGSGWYRRSEPVVYIVPPKMWLHSILELVRPPEREIPLKTLPEGLTTFSGVDDLAPTFFSLKTMFEAGAVERGGTRVTATTINKIARSIVCRQFGVTDVKAAQNWRLSLLANLVAFAPSATMDSAKDFLKAVPENLAYIVGHSVISPLVPHLKGLSATIETKYVRGMTTILMEQIRSRVETEEWMSVDHLIADCFSQYESPQLLGTIERFSPTAFKDTLSDECLSFGDLHRHYVIPLNRGMIMMLAACGIVEIAFDKTAPVYCYADNVRYFRLTDVGRFVFGLTDSVSLPGNVSEGELFEVDPDRLIVSNLAENNPYLMFLDRLGRKIGVQRYVLEPEKIVARFNCNWELKRLMGQLEKYVTGPRDTLSEVWQNFYSEIEQRMPEVVSLYSMDYDIYRLNPDNKLLIDTIVGDPEIRGLVNLAENYIILVKRSEHYEFENRLAKLGFRLSYKNVR